MGNNYVSGRKDDAVSRPKNTASNGRRVDRGRTYKRIDQDCVEVYDLDTSAWLLMKGVAVSEIVKTSSREIIVVFLDKEDRVPGLVIDFLNSETSKFASAIRSLKKAGWSAGRR